MGSNNAEFVVKDSGERAEFDSGMVRDVETGKMRYDLVFDGPMLERWAEQLTKGAVKYAPRNWLQAAGDEEYQRFRRSALRHFIQWFRGDLDEDHAAAVFFNINGAEYVREQPGNHGDLPDDPNPEHDRRFETILPAPHNGSSLREWYEHKPIGTRAYSATFEDAVFIKREHGWFLFSGTCAVQGPVGEDVNWHAVVESRD